MPETEKDLALVFLLRPPDTDRGGRTGFPPAVDPNSREGVDGLPADVLGLPASNDERIPLKSRLGLFKPERDLLRFEKPKSGNDSDESRRSRCCLLVLGSDVVVPLDEPGLAAAVAAEEDDAKALLVAPGELTRAA